MKHIQKWITYSIFILTLSIFFIYFLFPSDSVKRYIIVKVSRVNPNYKITIGRVFPTFPPGIRLNAVNIEYFDGLFLDAENIVITPKLISFFGQKRTFFFKVDAHEGIFQGKVDITGKNDGRHVYMDADINGIQLATVPALKNQTAFKISGILDAKIAYENRPISGLAILARVQISQCEVETSTLFLKQDSFNFRRIEADLLINNKSINISRCNLKGEQIDAMVSGSGVLKDPLNKSIIDMSGTILPRPSFLMGSKNDSNEPILGKTEFEGRKISFRINGSLDNPSLSLK